MLKSMTGFGRGQYEDENFSITVEMKTVNHRYNEVAIRLPRFLNPLEDKIRKTILKTVNRGRIDVFINADYTTSENCTLKVDKNLAAAYHKALQEVGAAIGLEELNINSAQEVMYLSRCQDVINVKEGFFDVEIVWHKVEQAVIKAINSEYLNQENASPSDYTGNLILVKDIITKYIRQGIIPHDIRNNAFALLHCEEDISARFAISDGREVVIGGIADRIDSLDSGNLRVVDYKTGRSHLEITNIESLFEGENRNNHRYPLQTMLYSMVLHRTLGRNIEPALYFARDMNREDYSPQIIHHDDNAPLNYTTYAKEFEQLLRRKLDELFDMERPFERCSQEESKNICAYCDFKKICNR